MASPDPLPVRTETKPILLYCEAPATEQAAMAEALPAVELVGLDGPLRADRPLPVGTGQAEIVSIGRQSRLEWTTLQRLPNLRLAAVRSARVSQVDLDACAEAGVTVCNVPHFGDPTVAEHTFALLLAVSRRLLLPYQGAAADDEGQWRGWDLAGKTVGVVGLGHIGRRVARLARAFAMPVLAYDVRPDVVAAEDAGLRLLAPADLRNWVRPVDRGELEGAIRFLPLDELLARADIVSLHVPYVRQTHHIIDAAALARMKRGAVLINTARGGLVDLAAVRAALGRGHLGGAGLDVVESDETLLLDESAGGGAAQRRQAVLEATADLLRLPNVVISPHNAYHSAETHQRIVATTIETIRRFLAGQPVNVVDPATWS